MSLSKVNGFNPDKRKTRYDNPSPNKNRLGFLVFGRSPNKKLTKVYFDMLDFHRAVYQLADFSVWVREVMSSSLICPTFN